MTKLYYLGKHIGIFVFLFFIVVDLCNAQIVITNGTTMKVSGGTTVTSTLDMQALSGGTLTNDGTIDLKGNFSNSGTATLGTGTIILSGTGDQTISGSTASTFTNLTVNKSSGGVTWGNSSRVEGVLTLTNGLITLGSNNLTLGPAATISGTPSATKMVVATGTGEMRKEFSSTGSFTFPVGDNTSTAEYSPVTLNFTAGTFGAGAYAGVNLVDAIYPDPNITGDYITRYWNLSSSGITGFTTDANFTYVDADINGTEANMYCVKIAPSPVVTYSPVTAASNLLTASGLTSFSSFTGMRAALSATLYAYLEGPFNTTSVNMSTTLTTLPLGDKTDLSKFPNSQPYGIAPYDQIPFAYTGTESVTSLPTGVVDWVLVELRSAPDAASATYSTMLAKRAGFIMQDGSIVAPYNNGGTADPLRFDNVPITGTNKAFFVIRHRNHLAIMSANEVTRGTNGLYTYDFRSNQSNTYMGSYGIKPMLNGSSTVVGYAMFGGNGYPNALIDTDDINFSWNTQFPSTGYYSGDWNLNTLVDTDDINFIWNTNFPSSGGITDAPVNFVRSMVP